MESLHKKWHFWFLLSSSSIFVLLAGLDVIYSYLPFHSLYLFVYSTALLVVSIWFTFAVTQKVLARTSPLNIRQICLKNTLLSAAYEKLPLQSAHAPPTTPQPSPKPNENVDKLINDVEVLFIKSWYSSISSEASFPAETKQIAEHVVKKFIQIAKCLDSKALAVGFSNIFLKHLKEYRRAVRRADKMNISLEQAYRCPFNNGKCEEALKASLQALSTVMLKEFISWELWSTLPCKLLTSILAKGLLMNSLTLVSTPSWINYQLVSTLANNEFKSELQLEKYCLISIASADEPESNTDATMAEIAENPAVPEAQISDEVDCITVEKEPAIVCREPIKEYQPKPSRTVEYLVDSDSNISFGTEATPELLVPGRRLWADHSDLNSDAPDRGQNLWEMAENWFREEPSKGPSPTAGSSSSSSAPAPSGGSLQQLLRPATSSLQATANAMHRIEDEAAGVVEGILDLGRAGILRGLRLTGLQANGAASEAEAGADDHSPEYEEPVDFPSAIAKLRTLLQQRANESAPPQALSPSPQMVQMQVDGPGLIARTVTGVFNSIRTAAGGATSSLDQTNQWAFQDTVPGLEHCLDSLLSERRDFCTVDAACEAVDFSASSDLVWPDQPDDDGEELDAALPLTKAVLDLACECISGGGADSLLCRELIVKSLLVVCGDVCEEGLALAVSSLAEHLVRSISLGQQAKRDTNDTLTLSFERIVDAVVSALPVPGSLISPVDVENAVAFLVGSLQHESLTRMVAMQAMELFVGYLVKSAQLSYPPTPT